MEELEHFCFAHESIISYLFSEFEMNNKLEERWDEYKGQ